VKGPAVFKEYWNKPEATKEAFTTDGYFKTGDIVSTIKDEDGSLIYKIEGRESVDIIKSSGYKISALDVERSLLSHPNIKDCAVLGIEDQEYGQRVAAILVPNNKNEKIELEPLREWGKKQMAYYKVPSIILQVDEIPKNAMGKVNKKELVKLFKM